MKKCRICKSEIEGRRDKQFCSVTCKNEYHTKLRAATNRATASIDKILHRNRSILLELMGKNASSKRLPRIELTKKKFNFGYLTGFHVNKEGKMYHHVYDFSWMIFRNEEILIVRKGGRNSYSSMDELMN